MKKKDSERKLSVELMAGLKEHIAVNHFEKAFDDLLLLLPDLCYDIPKAAEYTGFFLAQGIISEFISMDFVTPDKLIKISPHMAEVLLAQYLKILKQKDTQLLETAYLPFSHSLQNFVKDKNKEKFLKANDLYDVLGGDQQPAAADEQPDQEEVPESKPEPEHTTTTTISTESESYHQPDNYHQDPETEPHVPEHSSVVDAADLETPTTTTPSVNETDTTPETIHVGPSKKFNNNKTKGKGKKKPKKRNNNKHS
jgi:hypothetical protein